MIKKQQKTKKISKKKIVNQNETSSKKQRILKPKGQEQKQEIKKKQSKEQKIEDKEESDNDASLGYTADQYKKYTEIKIQLRDKTNKQLQDMLVLNDQTKTGTKDELISKVADGIVIGQIPKCPKCFGGKLKFAIATGVYKCPGYQDDTCFQHCNKKFQFNEIQRLEWKSS